VSTGRDDDALSWGGDDDPTLDVGARPEPEPAPAPALPDGFTAVGRGSEALAGRADVPADAAEDAPPASLSNVALVTIGIIAGIYLLYTIGWIVGGSRLAGTAQFLVSPVGYQFALWLAIAAPALWFGTAYALTRGTKTWIRVLWLAAGLALLVPWPFIMVGAVGQ